ncbi:putative leucine-rich repeat domain superfamily [Helianthus debilis subsp. tardiflorus]
MLKHSKYQILGLHSVKLFFSYIYVHTDSIRCFRVTDVGISHLVNNCKHIVHLNLSGCKFANDSESYLHLESLDITQCVKITDGGLQHVMVKCSGLKSLNLYALSRCVRVTDAGVIAIGQGCTSLEFLSHFSNSGLAQPNSYIHSLFVFSSLFSNGPTYRIGFSWPCRQIYSLCIFISFKFLIIDGCKIGSLFGIIGVTDKCLEALSKFCSNTLMTLDVNECIGIKVIQRRSREEPLQLFPYVRCFKVHS